MLSAWSSSASIQRHTQSRRTSFTSRTSRSRSRNRNRNRGRSRNSAGSIGQHFLRHLANPRHLRDEGILEQWFSKCSLRCTLQSLIVCIVLWFFSKYSLSWIQFHANDLLLDDLTIVTAARNESISGSSKTRAKHKPSAGGVANYVGHVNSLAHLGYPQALWQLPLLNNHDQQSSSDSEPATRPEFQSDSQFIDHYSSFYHQDISDFSSSNVYSAPSSSISTASPSNSFTMPDSLQGILFLAHGCNHRATDFWDHDSVHCPTCIGLPEEKRLIRLALERKLIPIAISSQDNFSKCWMQHDSTIVTNVLCDFQQFLNTELFPYDDLNGVIGEWNWKIYAFGASSGGSFVSFLAHHLLESRARQDLATDNRSNTDEQPQEHTKQALFTLSGVMIQISSTFPDIYIKGISAHLFEADTDQDDSKSLPVVRPQPQSQRPYPPVVFWHMPRDSRTSTQVHVNIQQIETLNEQLQAELTKDQSIDSVATYASRMIPYLETKCFPASLESKFFSKHLDPTNPRIPGTRPIAVETISKSTSSVSRGNNPPSSSVGNINLDKLSEALFNTLIENDWLKQEPELEPERRAKAKQQSAEYLLKFDPRKDTSWRDLALPVLKAFQINDTLVSDQSPISELMNVAYAKHEITSERGELVFDWLLQNW